MKGMHKCYDTSGKQWRLVSKANLCSMLNTALANQPDVDELVAGLKEICELPEGDPGNTINWMRWRAKEALYAYQRTKEQHGN